MWLKLTHVSERLQDLPLWVWPEEHGDLLQGNFWEKESHTVHFNETKVSLNYILSEYGLTAAASMSSQTTAVVGNIPKQTNLHMRSQKINWEETHDKFSSFYFWTHI